MRLHRKLINKQSKDYIYGSLSGNYLLTYLRKIPYNPPNSISSKKLKEDIILRGEPTAPTPDITISNNQIATTLFVNVKLFVKQFEHITASTYTIQEGCNLIVEFNGCILTLPTGIAEGTMITIVNSSDGFITINSGLTINPEYMYNQIYTSSTGTTNLSIYKNVSVNFTYIINTTTNTNWWSIFIS